MKSPKGWMSTALPVCIALSMVVAGPAAASGATPLLGAEASPTESVTASEVTLASADVDESYTVQEAISEAAGDEQQRTLVGGSAAASESETEDGVARIDLQSDISVIGVTWDPREAAPRRVDARYLTGGVWSEWQELEIESDPNGDPDSAPDTVGTEPLVLVDARAVEVVARGAGEDALDIVKVQVIDPRGGAVVGNSLHEVAATDTDGRTGTEANVPNSNEAGTVENETPEDPLFQDGLREDGAVTEDEGEVDPGDTLLDLEGVAESEPTSALQVVPASLSADGSKFSTGLAGLVLTTRKGWGANEGYRKGFVDINVNYRGAVVHHTAGNNNYSQAQVPGQIQGVYYYHAVTLGWGDIGYHLVVDKYGGVWEGRYGTLTSSPRGAHAYGANHETFGISVLGDYTDYAPPQVAQDAVAKAIAWQFGVRGIRSAVGSISVPGVDLKGRTVNVISGHRDVGGTSCPGNAFYTRLPNIRSQVAAYMRAGSAPMLGADPVWRAGNLISDAAFYNSNTMTESQIQSFLDTEGAGCVASGGATCLKSARFPTQPLTTIRGGCGPLNLTGSQSAAKIIAETSRACGINPQVILATIQKEQSGVTQPRTAETWAKAMGSGCPTGQSCDASQAGFAKQVYFGADKLVSYKLDSSWSYVSAFERGATVTVPNNVDTKCGSQSFKIENYATASLYMYTPYVGDSSAAGCPAVGAKSFWNIMARWFPGSLGGTLPAEQWVQVSGVWYRTGTNGVPLTGWFQDGAAWYFLDYYSGAMQTGWLLDGSTWYYLSSSGAMQTGWTKVGSTWYYLSSSGAMQTGWVEVGSARYYLSSSGAMQTGWTKVGSTWYYLSSSGAMQTGWVRVGSVDYQLDSSGAWIE